MTELSARQARLHTQSPGDFSGLKAVFLHCTRKLTPAVSHTQGLIDIARAIVEKNGVEVAVLRPVDDDIAYGVWPAMRKHGGPNDAWPGILEKMLAAQILVVASPIWLGDESGDSGISYTLYLRCGKVILVFGPCEDVRQASAATALAQTQAAAR